MNKKRLELIDRNALCKKMFYVEEKQGGHGWVISLEDVSKAHTVDAVEVVHGQKWIPVSERLPNESENIILVTDCEYPHRLPRVVRRKALTEEEFWGVSVGFFAHGVKFTHWMPVPELPEEET